MNRKAMATEEDTRKLEERLEDCEISLGLSTQYLGEVARLLSEAYAELQRLKRPPDDGHRAPNS